MPAQKPLHLHHIHDYRPRFDERTHLLILQLTAELTRLNGGEPIPKNVVLRALAERQISLLNDDVKADLLADIHTTF